MSMPVEEFDLWHAYYSVKADEEQNALNKQKMSLKRR